MNATINTTKSTPGSVRWRIDDILEILDGMVDLDDFDIDHNEIVSRYGTVGMRTMIRNAAGDITIRQCEGHNEPYLDIVVHDRLQRECSSAREVSLPTISVAYMLAAMIENWKQ